MRYIKKEPDSTAYIIIEDCLHNVKEYCDSDIAKDLLTQMYSNSCTYCESTPAEGCYMQIEHFYPKSIAKWMKYQKDIRNLHLACPACNTQKRDDDEAKYLSPNYYLEDDDWQCHNEDDVENAMYYKGPFIYANQNATNTKEEAEYTIKKLKLNERPFLVESRLRVYSKACTLLETLCDLLENYNSNLDSAISLTFKNLIEMTESTSHYSTMVLQNFGESICQLLEIWQKKRI